MNMRTGLLAAMLLLTSVASATPLALMMHVNVTQCEASGTASCDAFTPLAFRQTYNLNDFQPVQEDIEDDGEGHISVLKVAYSPVHFSATPFTPTLLNFNPAVGMDPLGTTIGGPFLLWQHLNYDYLIHHPNPDGSPFIPNVSADGFASLSVGVDISTLQGMTTTRDAYYQSISGNFPSEPPFTTFESLTTPRLQEFLTALGPLRWSESVLHTEGPSFGPSLVKNSLSYIGTARYAASSVSEPSAQLLMTVGVLASLYLARRKNLDQ